MREFTELRAEFPILRQRANGYPLIYLDNAATTQKPEVVINAVNDYYREANANVHRASHFLSARATHAFEDARDTVRRFLNAGHTDEIIWTRGATEAINLVAHSWGLSTLKAGDEILISAMEHHANIVPWQQVCRSTGASLKVIPIHTSGELDMEAFRQLLGPQTRLVSICQVSNAIGTVNPIPDIIREAHTVGARVLIDGSQAVAHFPVDVQAQNCDFYVFSGHKVYSPTGIGVLYGKRDLLQAMPPWQTGGEMIERVSFEGTTFNSPPFRFEAGTPNVVGALGLAAAIDFLEQCDHDQIQTHEKSLLAQATEGLNAIPGLQIIGTAPQKTSVISFVMEGLHNQDIGTLLDQQGIAVRTGHHCTMPLMSVLNLSGTVRASIALYNTEAEIQTFIEAVAALQKDSLSFTTETEHATTAATTIPDAFTYESPQVGDAGSLIEELQALRGWQERYRHIMLLGKKLPALPEPMKRDENRLHGCESTVWLHHYYDETTMRLYFAIDSDARIVRGLITLILSALNGRTPEAIENFDMEACFDQLGLMHHLSPSRGNGIRAIVKEIQLTAHRYR